MARTADDWSTYQLTEFMDGVSRADDEAAAIQLGVERAAEALDAEVAAIVVRTSVRACVGFPREAVPERELIAMAEGRQAEIEVPGVGSCTGARVTLQSQPPGVLFVARHSDEPIEAKEKALLAGMARALALTQRLLRVVDGERALRAKVERQAEDNAKLLTTLQERQRLLERLTEVQRSISSRAPVGDVIETIVDGAAQLFEDEIVALRLLDPRDRGYLLLAAVRGITPEVAASVRRLPVDEGATSRAITTGRLVVLDNYAHDPTALAQLVADDVTAVMAAPVFEAGEVSGTLVVGSRTAARVFSRPEQEALTAFAEHVGLALTDATPGVREQLAS